MLLIHRDNLSTLVNSRRERCRVRKNEWEREGERGGLGQQLEEAAAAAVTDFNIPTSFPAHLCGGCSPGEINRKSRLLLLEIILSGRPTLLYSL